MPIDRLDVVVSGVRRLTEQVREFVLTPAAGVRLPAFDAGAHVVLHLDTAGGPLLRHYSLVGGDTTQGDGQHAYRIAVQRSRRLRGSAFLHDHVVVGTRLAVSHPRNHFSLDRRDTHSLLIAGGIGITPILSMARSLALRKRPFALVYAGRAPQDMAYLSEVRSLAGATVQVHCSTEHGGARLDLHALLAAQPAGTTTYVCGPATLIAATRAAAKALSWEPARVRSESFASVPANDDSGFALVLHKSGRTLQVAADASILETMAAAGLTPLFDCGMGECGVCPLVVLQADGSLEHRDRYLSAEAKAAGDALCICVSRLRGTRLVLDA